MSNIDKQALREAAEMATESDWIVDAHEGWHAVIPVADAVNGNYIIAEFQGPESKRNRDYVAVANPATVLALLDELEAAQKRIIEVYATPPAPVSVTDIKWPEEKFCPAEYAGSQLWEETEIWNKAIDACKAACRAAMLQGADPVTTTNKFPFEQWLSQQTGTIDVECGCVMTEVFFHWLRVAYEAGNSPVIPDGWVLVPVEPTMSQEFAGYRTLTDTGKMSRLMKTRLSNIYRAMIATAPQQEVN